MRNLSAYSDVRHVEVEQNAPVSCATSGEGRKEQWLVDGKLHRFDGPAILVYDNAGRIQSESWYVNDCRHRGDGPAVKLFDRVGRLVREEWWRDGRLDREDGPAVVEYAADGVSCFEEWWTNGERWAPDQIRAFYQTCNPDTSPLVLRMLAESAHVAIRRAVARHPLCPLDVVGSSSRPNR